MLHEVYKLNQRITFPSVFHPSFMDYPHVFLHSSKVLKRKFTIYRLGLSIQHDVVTKGGFIT